jgi:hypothetical protein
VLATLVAEMNSMTATAKQVTCSRPRWQTRWLLVVVEFVVAVNAVGGAVWGLAGAKNVPREWLDGTPFHSYLIPNLILLVAVGGGMSIAALALVVRHRLAPEVSVAAALILVVWITAQVLIIVPDGGFSWLQPTMFAAGLVIAALGWRLRRQRQELAGGGRSQI